MWTWKISVRSANFHKFQRFSAFVFTDVVFSDGKRVGFLVNMLKNDEIFSTSSNAFHWFLNIASRYISEPFQPPNVVIFAALKRRI